MSSMPFHLDPYRFRRLQRDLLSGTDFTLRITVEGAPGVAWAAVIVPGAYETEQRESFQIKTEVASSSISLCSGSQ